jgi:taurine dioxygenase
MLIVHATSPAFTYFHAWDVGDGIVGQYGKRPSRHAYNNDGTVSANQNRTGACVCD